MVRRSDEGEAQRRRWTFCEAINIHNCDMDGQSYLSESDYETTRHENIWTRSLYLHAGKVMVKTFDHQKREWMESLTREIPFPK